MGGHVPPSSNRELMEGEWQYIKPTVWVGLGGSRVCWVRLGYLRLG